MREGLQTTEISESDLPAVADFIATQIRPGEARDPGALPLADRLRWVLLDNPARQGDVPLGWCIRDGARVVGTLLVIPYRLAAGTFSCVALTASQFYVDSRHRGAGIGPFMRYLQWRSRFVLLNMTANPVSAAMFAKCGAAAIAGADHTLLGIARAGPLVEEWFYRRTHQPTAARLLAAPANFAPARLKTRDPTGETSLIPIRSADEAASLAGHSSEHRLAVVRNRDYLHWRYFTGDLGRDAWAFQVEGEAHRLVIVNCVRLGHRGQIRVLNVLDVWPPTTARSAPLLTARVAMHYRGTFDAIWLRSQPSEAEAALCEGGFVRHAFPAPLGWCIDSANRLPTHDFYLMPGESE